MIKLAESTIDSIDIECLIQWLGTDPQLTQGAVVEQFEAEWSQRFSNRQSVMVSSGSTAILAALYALKLTGLRNLKVVVPAVSWATDYSSVVQLGMEPLICDCNLQNLAVDMEMLEDLFKKEAPSILILVQVLGLVPAMEDVAQLCNQYGVILVEDCCEALGSKYKGKLLGEFGKISLFSFYYGHHLSTIEGGMLTTSDEALADTLRMVRSHGWSRSLCDVKKKALRADFNVSEFQEAFTFYVPGFNLRSTNLNAQIGLNQLKKLDWVIEQRSEIFNNFRENFRLDWKPQVETQNLVSCFGYPIITEQRDELAAHLVKNGIECRPLIGGSLCEQPMVKVAGHACTTPNASHVHYNGMYIPCHPYLTEEDQSKIIETVNNFFM